MNDSDQRFIDGLVDDVELSDDSIEAMRVKYEQEQEAEAEAYLAKLKAEANPNEPDIENMSDEEFDAYLATSSKEFDIACN